MSTSTFLSVNEKFLKRAKDLNVDDFLGILVKNIRSFPVGKSHPFRKVTPRNIKKIIETYFPFSLLIAMKLLEDHPNDFEEQYLKDLTQQISSALQSNIPGLAQLIAISSARLLKSNGEKYIIETLVDDIERENPLAGDYTASAVALAKYAQTEKIPDYSYNYLVSSLQSPKGISEKLNLLSIIDRPSEFLVSFLKDILAKNPESKDRWEADLNSPTLLVASKMLTRWGTGGPQAINILGKHIRRYPKPSTSVIKSIERGFGERCNST